MTSKCHNTCSSGQRQMMTSRHMQADHTYMHLQVDNSCLLLMIASSMLTFGNRHGSSVYLQTAVQEQFLDADANTNKQHIQDSDVANVSAKQTMQRETLARPYHSASAYHFMLHCLVLFVASGASMQILHVTFTRPCLQHLLLRTRRPPPQHQGRRHCSAPTRRHCCLHAHLHSAAGVVEL